jgi:hypothetical protein
MYYTLQVDISQTETGMYRPIFTSWVYLVHSLHYTTRNWKMSCNAMMTDDKGMVTPYGKCPQTYSTSSRGSCPSNYQQLRNWDHRVIYRMDIESLLNTGLAGKIAGS